MSDENQHWVPKFLVKNFSDRDGRVFCLDIHTDRITKPAPRQAASEKGFNDFEVDGEAISFEDRLEKIETQAAPILKRMIDERQLTTLTGEDRRRVAAFVAAQSFRTKAFYEGLSGKNGLELLRWKIFAAVRRNRDARRRNRAAALGADDRERRRRILSW